MDTNLLIEAIVRQTTVLIAQLATMSGGRAMLAGTANQVFLNLVLELKQQGLGHKVIAEMFGLALRTYHNRLQRLAESRSVAGRSLWDAVLDYVKEQGPVPRAQVLRQFVRDEPLQVRAVLNDLVSSELLVRTGRTDGTTYRLATAEDHDPASEASASDGLLYLVWVAIHRFGPIDVRRLAELVPASEAELQGVVARLEQDGRVQRQGQPEMLTAEHYLVPTGIRAGFEASLFDHYQAMVAAICIKLRSNQLQALPSDWVGGSTYVYDVWEGHPLHDEVAGFLASVRGLAVDLRQRVEAHNASASPPADAVVRRFTAYVGQGVVSDERVESD